MPTTNPPFSSQSIRLLSGSPLTGLPFGYYVTTLPQTCFAATFDGAGNLYCANEDHSLVIFYLVGGFSQSKTLVADIGFFPFGIALDNVRGFVYISSAVNNEIVVYNTSGTLLTTIHD